MFESGKTYFYHGAIGWKPSFKDDSGNDLYLEDGVKCVLTNGKDSVVFIKGVWEPKFGKDCRCTNENPLTLECEYECKVEPTEEERHWASVVRDGLKKVGITASDVDCVLLIDEFEWHFSNQGMARCPDVFVEFLVDRLNRDYLQVYTGSHSGYGSHEKFTKFIFNLVFGIKGALIVKQTVESYVECEAKLENNSIRLYVKGVPFEQYCEQVLLIPMNKGKVSDLLKSAEG